MLIFLDIDGVLVPATGWKPAPNLADGFPSFTKKATTALQDLLSDNPTIILSSSHRDRFTIIQWKKIFFERGLNINNLDRLQPRNGDLKRNEEIQEWFTTHAVNEDFVIIDDDSRLNDLPEHLRAHLLVTSPLVGLTPEHVPRVRALASKK